MILNEKNGKEVDGMTDYEIIMIFLSILALLISVISVVIAFLALLDKKRREK